MLWDGGCYITPWPLSCSSGPGDRGEGWLQGREAGASGVGAPQPALPPHQILLSLLAACPSLVCTPQLQAWPAPGLPREAQDKQAKEKKRGVFEGRNDPSILFSATGHTHSLSALPPFRYKRCFRGFISHVLLSADPQGPPPSTALPRPGHSLGASYTGAWAARTQEDATTPTPCLAVRDRR